MGAPRSDPAREITSSRVFAAEPERVFAAFVDATQLAAWWGPQGFTTRIAEYNPRPGGRWRGAMRSADGQEYPIEKRFVEVVPSTRVVLRHEQAGHDFTMTMIFAAAPGGTRLTWHFEFDSAADCAPVRGFILVANEQNFDRLAAHLAAQNEKNAPTMSGPRPAIR